MSVWLYRKHRELLIDAMKTLKEFNSCYDMLLFISHDNNCDLEDISIRIYSNSPDLRIGWNHTYLVCVNGCAIGFCTELL